METTKSLSKFQKVTIGLMTGLLSIISLYLLIFGDNTLHQLAADRIDLSAEWHDLDDQRTELRNQITDLEIKMKSIEDSAATLDDQIEVELTGF